MDYKAVINEPSYLCHFNKNHDPKNGRFTFKNDQSGYGRRGDIFTPILI